MNWNKLKRIKTIYLFGISISIPIVIFAIVFFFKFGDYISDHSALGQRILLMTIILFVLYGTIIFLNGFKFKQIGLSFRNAVLGLLYSGILYFIFHLVLILLAFDKMQNNDNQTLFTLPTLPLNIIGFAIFLSVVWEEFVYRAFLLPQFQLLFRKVGYRKSIIISILVTQIIFALHHLGNRILIQNMDFQNIIIDQILLIVIGAILCVIYILSENLTYTIMVHLFMNFPILFISGIKIPTQYLTFSYLLMGLIGAWIIYEFKKHAPGQFLKENRSHP